MEACIICGEQEPIKEFQIKETDWCVDCLKQHNTIMMQSHNFYFCNNIKKPQRKK